MDKNKAKEAAAVLVDRFGEQIDSYKSGHYNEAQTRLDFINPLFKALGWDVDNQAGYAEAYREVIYEDKIKIAGATKAPDYSFRLPGGKRLFFVEAKKPSVSVKDEIQPAYQVRRYGWSAKLPISIISDFEEFAVYDCTTKPSPSDKAANARINYLTFTDYIAEFDFLWDTFSKESVLKGSFDKFVVGESKKRGTSSVDKEFLTSLDNWRTVLAVNIAKNNPALNEFELNFAVQQTLDRIIFLRIAEDRRVEPYGTLQSAVKSGELYYKNLFSLFRRADEKYNSGLFDFKLDKLSDKLVIENKTLKSIINELYYPVSPYEFSVLSVEILGSAYEQFLGKTIRISGAHRAKIEEKPEVRKAGGVYYTPQYIVDYIVKNTVGKLIEGKTPAEIEKIKIVDPACGSGSFLLGAYDYLLSYHREYYNSHPAAGSKKDNPLNPDGFLTSAVKKRILINNIFGVDIDANAVEVTKLSLLLKCLEGETEASISTQLSLWNDRVLPTLDDNIKSGNSLIDTDFYDQQLDFGEIHKIKAFNWQKSFPSVFAQGGFDAVIGNPPYVKIQNMNLQSTEIIKYYQKTFQTAASKNYDLYVLFIEKSSALLNPSGVLGFIVPNKFFVTDYGVHLRKLLSRKRIVSQINDFNDFQVFENASVYTCLLFLENKQLTDVTYISSKNGENGLKSSLNSTFSINALGEEPWHFFDRGENNIISKLVLASKALIDLPCSISRGISTGNDKIYIVTINSDDGYTNGFMEKVDIEPDLLKIPVFATDFNRFYFNVNSNYRLIYPYNSDEESEILSEQTLKNDYPKTYRYLQTKKVILNQRKQFSSWYGYSAPRNLWLHSKAEILIPLLANRGMFSKTPVHFKNYTLMASGGFSIHFPQSEIDSKYVLGLLNSKLLFWYLNKISNVFRGGWITCTKQYFGRLPIIISLKYKTEVCSLVDRLTELYLSLSNCKLKNEKEHYLTTINHFEQNMDEIVYEMYGLSSDEIKLIESGE
ncbi:MAG: N-6 DNA methylase [Ignavibacteriaceae bacterium]|nr:N-6 DNA methylase [Ignavibacteriaceae bacterium]